MTQGLHHTAFTVPVVVYTLQPIEWRINGKTADKEGIVWQKQAKGSHNPERVAKSNYFG